MPIKKDRVDTLASRIAVLLKDEPLEHSILALAVALHGQLRRRRKAWRTWQTERVIEYIKTVNL